MFLIAHLLRLRQNKYFLAKKKGYTAVISTIIQKQDNLKWYQCSATGIRYYLTF